MRSGAVSVHLILDASVLYNVNYHEKKLQLGLTHGPELVLEHDRKLECAKSGKPYHPEPFVSDIRLAMQQGMAPVTAEPETVLRLAQLTQQLSAIPCKDRSSYNSVLEVLKQCSNEMDKGLVNFVTRLPELLQQELVIQANQVFIQHVLADAKRGASVFVANGSPSQFYNIKLFEALTKDTGCIFSDMQALVAHMRAQVEKPGLINLDALTLYDAAYDLPAGDHFKNVLVDIQQFTHFPESANLEFISTYLHAHFHASHHGDVPVDLFCYVSTDAALAQLKQQLQQYHTRFPANVKIIVQKCQGAMLESVECVGGAEKPVSNVKAHAKQLLKELSDKSFDETPEQEDSYYAAMLDADNCIYNVYYFMLLTLLVEKYGLRIAASKNADMKSEEMVTLAKEMLDFVSSYSADNLFHKSVNYKNMILRRNVVLKEFADLPIAEDILKMRDAMLADDAGIYKNNAHGPAFCQLVRLINAISPKIMTTIIYRANEALFSDMKQDAKDMHANKIALMIASLRQNYLQDLKNSVWNGTGHFHGDLKRLVTFLNEMSAPADPTFVFDDATLLDYSRQLAPGVHLASSHTKLHQTADILCDNEKRMITYEGAHHGRRKHRVKAIDFFDDSKRVIDGVTESYGENDKHGLLPAGLRLTLIGYDGKYMGYEKSIVGRGVVDQHPYDMIYYINMTQEGIHAVLTGQLDHLPLAREQVSTRKMREFVEMTRWCQPEIYFTPARAKTMRRISRALDILHEEINRFCLCSPRVKHGLYAGRQSLPAREISAIYREIQSGSVDLNNGLQKIMTLAQYHLPIYHAAKKLRNLMCGADEEQAIKMSIARRRK